MASVATSEIERVFRAEYGRAVSVLVRHFGDIDVAEEAVQDAFTAALQRWPSTGLPPSPVGWIITTARNRAIESNVRTQVKRVRTALTEKNKDGATQALATAVTGSSGHVVALDAMHPAERKYIETLLDEIANRRAAQASSATGRTIDVHDLRLVTGMAVVAKAL